MDKMNIGKDIPWDEIIARLKRTSTPVQETRLEDWLASDSNARIYRELTGCGKAFQSRRPMNRISKRAGTNSPPGPSARLRRKKPNPDCRPDVRETAPLGRCCCRRRLPRRRRASAVATRRRVRCGRGTAHTAVLHDPREVRNSVVRRNQNLHAQQHDAHAEYRNRERRTGSTVVGRGVLQRGERRKATFRSGDRGSESRRTRHGIQRPHDRSVG